MKKILAVIDVQNDFITGKLANPDADKAVPNIVKTIEEFEGDMIICTFDTHYDWNYAKSKEGRAIPEHCIWGSDGWREYMNDVYEAYDFIKGGNYYYKKEKKFVTCATCHREIKFGDLKSKI